MAPRGDVRANLYESIRLTNTSSGYYCAKAGYDNVTGLGVFDGANLEKALIALP